jgi:hypothetical protein
MTWTRDQIDDIPTVYRDFLLALRPVIDSRKRGAILQITAVPYADMYEYLRTHYDYSPDAIEQVARNLKARGLVEEDEYRFFVPTEKGAQLIEALAAERELAAEEVPALPDL